MQSYQGGPSFERYAFWDITHEGQILTAKAIVMFNTR